MKDWFQIHIKLPGYDEKATLSISHKDETFDFQLNGEDVSIINNGDNSWSIVTGNIPQETANLIGEAIERNYQDKTI